MNLPCPAPSEVDSEELRAMVAKHWRRWKT